MAASHGSSGALPAERRRLGREQLCFARPALRRGDGREGVEALGLRAGVADLLEQHRGSRGAAARALGSGSVVSSAISPSMQSE